MAAPPQGLVIIGIGNPDRGDDGAGVMVTRSLRGTLPEHVTIMEARGDAADLLARIETATVAYLVDACTSGAPAGTVRRFDAAAGPLPAGAFGHASTHGLGLADAIELARALGQLPQRCIVYAIEGASFEMGAALTPAVARAVTEAAAQLRGEIAGNGSPSAPRRNGRNPR